MDKPTKIAKEVNRLRKVIKTSSAPLAVVAEIGHYVLHNWRVIERALIESGQEMERIAKYDRRILEISRELRKWKKEQ